MSSQLIITGIIGYILVILKDIPKSLMSLFKTNFTSSITTSSNNGNSYRELNKYILSLDKKSIENNIETEEYKLQGFTHKIHSINYGKYFFKIDKLTYMIVNKELKENSYELSSILNITTFGLKRKEVIESVKNTISVDKTDYLNVFCSMSEYDAGILVPKKSFDNVYIENKDILKSKITQWVNNESLYN